LNNGQAFIDRVEARGGRLRVEGNRLCCANPDAVAPFLNELAGCKDEVVRLVRGRSADTTSSQLNEEARDVIQALLKNWRERRGR